MASVNVKVDNLFPNLVATKNIDMLKLNVTGSNFKKTFGSNIKTTLDGATLFNKNSINYLNIQIRYMLEYLLKPYCKNFVFNVCDIWLNKYDDNDYQESHTHPSDFSFIIYYKVDKSYTIFNNPVKNLLEMRDSKIFDKHCKPKLEQGDLIIFPSYLEHWVKPNSNNITIAGNIKIMEMIK